MIQIMESPYIETKNERNPMAPYLIENKEMKKHKRMESHSILRLNKNSFQKSHRVPILSKSLESNIKIEKIKKFDKINLKQFSVIESARNRNNGGILKIKEIYRNPMRHPYLQNY